MLSHIDLLEGNGLAVTPVEYEVGKVSEARIREISQVCLYGGVEITTPAMVELMQRNVPVLHFSHSGWFQGICLGMSHKNVLLRIKQFQWAGDEEKALSIARRIVSGKIENSRIQLRRYDPDGPESVLESLAALAKEAENASSRQSLLGIEGAAAAAYFSRFDSMLKVGDKNIIMALHLLHASPAAAIAFYDPCLGAVVVASHSREWQVGQVVDLTIP